MNKKKHQSAQNLNICNEKFLFIETTIMASFFNFQAKMKVS